MSEQARRIIKIFGENGKVSTILHEHPELAEGIDEYVEWRLYRQKQVKKNDAIPSTSHSLKSLRKG